jgi:hypothetical protein
MKVLLAGRRAIAVGAIALTALVVLPTASAGAAGPVFALKPASTAKLGYFVLGAKPGATVRGKVQVINVGTEAGKTSLYAVDATTGQTSGAVYRSQQEPRRGVGDWIKLGAKTVALAPGQSQIVPFTAKVPSGASGGEHLGGIVAQRSSSSASSSPAASGESGTFKVRVHALSVIAVQVNLPGPRRPKMSLSGIKAGTDPGHQALLLGIGNTGNVLVKGSGSLKVVNSSGRSVQRQKFNLDTFVPESRIDFPVYIEGKALKPGHYRGTVTIRYLGHRLTRTYPFTITAANAKQVFGSQAAQVAPPDSSSGGGAAIYVLAGIAALAIGAAGYFFMRSRRTV